MYALELQSYNTCAKARIGAPIATYERAANLARSVSNDPFWLNGATTPSSEGVQGAYPFCVAVAGGWVTVVKL
jgi:hypothetical protein